ncbi:hypothetical protein GIX45_10530 [Erwinia sp. CPCC 100877]|nr:hypothetical protein [Erwinia sp. CPCC 100877]
MNWSLNKELQQESRKIPLQTFTAMLNYFSECKALNYYDIPLWQDHKNIWNEEKIE